MTLNQTTFSGQALHSTYSQRVSPLDEINLVVFVQVGIGDRLLDVNDLSLSQIQFVHHTVVALLEELAQLNVALLVGNLALDLAISVIDNSDEHVQQDEEDEEDVGQEEDGTEHSVGRLEGLEIKVAENDAEQGVA